MDYNEFLESKRPKQNHVGFEPKFMPDMLYPFQKAITKWACRLGRAAIFADCGLGKTLMQLAWIENMRQGGTALIVAPLGVTDQTIDEGKRINLSLAYVTRPDEMKPKKISITNYERLHHFVGADLAAIVLDESSILKSIDGKTRTLIIKEFSQIKYRLCCTATPAPNDISELGNHAEFLGALSMKEMLATFFVNRADLATAKWMLKAHGRKTFYRWLASWGMYMRSPEDIGFVDDRFRLPTLSINDMIVRSNYRPVGQLFPGMGAGIRGRLEARRETIGDRVLAIGETIKKSQGPWLVWCGLNQEGRELHSILNNDSVLVEGQDSADKKIESWHRWRDGNVRVMISKPSIFGFGMNFQFCNQMAFLGLGDSYEQYYQAIRRCWRYGQENPVDVTIVISDLEQGVAANVRRKEEMSETTAKEMVKEMSEFEKQEIGTGRKIQIEHNPKTESGLNWSLTMGDAINWIETINADSIDMSVFSPPFQDLYVYTATERDIGNSSGRQEYFGHFGFLISGLLKATKPGRLCCVHVSQIPSIKYVDGYIGLKDFRGDVVEEFKKRGWIYHGEVVIDKDPQVQAIRTKSKGLLFVSLKRDASWLRPALADYILVFRKPGENKVPIRPTDISHDDWISWARPVWYGINETDVLQYRDARGEDDTKHICPLQLPVIERCVKLWSNVGELVCSPFAGIGSEGYVALKLGRKFLGCELKEEYWNVACKNIKDAVSQYELNFK